MPRGWSPVREATLHAGARSGLRGSDFGLLWRRGQGGSACREGLVEKDMAAKKAEAEGRTPEQIREHYEIEKELATKLRNAPKQERRRLYASLYDELYRRVPHHPQLVFKSSPEDSARAVRFQMGLLKPYLNEHVTFLEVGPGDCALALEVAKHVKQVYAVDVSAEITRDVAQPPNFDVILSDGTSVPVPPKSVHVAYSHQLMEHLHPDDALEQLENIYRALADGGSYLCITPNRLNGPHDVSRYFDRTASGFHLKEYTTYELRRLFRRVGLLRTRAFVGARGRYVGLSPFPICLCGKLLDRLPYVVRRPIAGSLPLKMLLGVRLMGIK